MIRPLRAGRTFPKPRDVISLVFNDQTSLHGAFFLSLSSLRCKSFNVSSTMQRRPLVRSADGSVGIFPAKISKAGSFSALLQHLFYLPKTLQTNKEQQGQSLPQTLGSLLGEIDKCLE